MTLYEGIDYTMTPEERKAAQVSLGQAYASYMADSASIRAKLKEEFRIRLEQAVEEELGHLKAKMGRALARSPLPVREKQRITSTTNWYRYQDLIEASGEIDVSSREGRMMQKLDSLKSEVDKIESQQKTDSDKNPLVATEVTDKMRSWEHYDGVLSDHTIKVEDDARWFEVQPTPGGVSRLWAQSTEESPYLVFEVPAGDDEWVSPVRVYDRGESKWEGERSAVKTAFDEEGPF